MIEDFFLTFYNERPLFLSGPLNLPSKDTVLQFFRENFTTDVSEIIKDIQDGYGANLISMFIDYYQDYNLILELYAIVAPLPNNVEQLFWIEDVSNWNSEHPVERMYTMGLKRVFKFINSVYNRQFNMLYDVNDYSDPSCTLDYILEDKNRIEELTVLLKKYEEEFNYKLISNLGFLTKTAI
jgi:hypothetical protein